jgi:ribose transport system ATP-binding protein
MDQLAAAGVALLMISSDLEEVLGMSDRVLVLHEGRIAGELSRDALSQEAVMRLATGGSLGSVGAMDPRPSDNIGPSSSSGGKT